MDDIFGGKSVFENILQYGEGHCPLAEMRRAASYLLVNQLVFYGILSRIDAVAYPPIDSESLRKPEGLDKNHVKWIGEISFIIRENRSESLKVPSSTLVGSSVG